MDCNAVKNKFDTAIKKYSEDAPQDLYNLFHTGKCSAAVFVWYEDIQFEYKTVIVFLPSLFIYVSNES